MSRSSFDLSPDEVRRLGRLAADAVAEHREKLADRPVFVFEIILARLKTQLAVLSACQTAEGIMQPGGYIQSLQTLRLPDFYC